MAVGFLDETCELLQGVFLAPELNHHGTADFVIVGNVLGDLGLQWHVFSPKKLHIRLPMVDQNGMARLLQGRAVGCEWLLLKPTTYLLGYWCNESYSSAPRDNLPKDYETGWRNSKLNGLTIS